MFWSWFNLIVHILMIVVNVAWCFVVFRLTQKRLWRVLIAVFMAVQIIALISLHTPIQWVAYGPKTFLVWVIVWNNLALGFGLAAFFALSILRVGSWVRRIASKKSSAPSLPDAQVSPAQNTVARREFIGACAALTPVLFAGGFTGLAMAQISDFRVRRLTLSLPTLPRALDGLTIAHVSDMHVGRITCGRVLKKLVTTTNNLRPDLVLLTGDLINYELSDLSEAMDLVKQMPGRYGQWLIEGNHDLLVDATEFRSRVKASGIPFLLNESATATVRGYPVQFFGLDWSDARGTRLDNIIAAQLSELMKRRQADAFPIFLAHHPHAFDAAVRKNLPLTLCGHTHGGQLMLNNQYGAGSILFRYWSGLYKRAGSQMVVSNGVGNMFPIRVNAPAEVIHLTLRCADARG
jgi:uncharacterized protein